MRGFGRVFSTAFSVIMCFTMRSGRFHDAAAGGSAPSGRIYDVFISHAGQQKANFAMWLQLELRWHGVSAFLDEKSLRLGDKEDLEMEAALRTCHIVVAILAPDFVRSAYCMQELRWALDCQQPHPRLCTKDGQPEMAASAEGPPLSSAAIPGRPRLHGTSPTIIPVFSTSGSIRSCSGRCAAAACLASCAGAPEALRLAPQSAWQLAPPLLLALRPAPHSVLQPAPRQGNLQRCTSRGRISRRSAGTPATVSTRRHCEFPNFRHTYTTSTTTHAALSCDKMTACAAKNTHTSCGNTSMSLRQVCVTLPAHLSW